jgi:hypothetical protein
VRITKALNICPFDMPCLDASLPEPDRPPDVDPVPDRAAFTDTIIESPTKAARPPPITLIHLAVFAPELSATRRILLFWIIAVLNVFGGSLTLKCNPRSAAKKYL